MVHFLIHYRHRCPYLVNEDSTQALYKPDLLIRLTFTTALD